MVKTSSRWFSLGGWVGVEELKLMLTPWVWQHQTQYCMKHCEGDMAQQPAHKSRNSQRLEFLHFDESIIIQIPSSPFHVQLFS